LTLDAWTRAHVTGVILNGGASRRLGPDKTLLRIGGRTLIERTLDTFAALFDEILVVGRPEACPAHPALTRALADAVPGAGPLAGVFTGLREMSRPFGFFAACDMPRLNAEVVHSQIEVLRTAPTYAVVPAWNGLWEPLHALYSQDCLPAARRQLNVGDYRILSFYDSVRVTFWDAVAAGVDPAVFANVNTKSDLAVLLGEEERKEWMGG